MYQRTSFFGPDHLYEEKKFDDKKFYHLLNNSKMILGTSDE